MYSTNSIIHLTKGTRKGMGNNNQEVISNILRVPEPAPMLPSKPTYLQIALEKNYLSSSHVSNRKSGFERNYFQGYRNIPQNPLLQQNQISDRPLSLKSYFEDSSEYQYEYNKVIPKPEVISERVSNKRISQQARIFETDEDDILNRALLRKSAPNLIRQPWHAMIEKEALLKNKS